MTDSSHQEISFEIHATDTPLPAIERERVMAEPGFGAVFTDHMATIRWTEGRGWHDARLEPYGPFTLDPATAVFHYAQEFFEGLKAYRQDNGSIALFRPDANAAWAALATPGCPGDAATAARTPPDVTATSSFSRTIRPVLGTIQ